jgi:uncharacterized membrane protein
LYCLANIPRLIYSFQSFFVLQVSAITRNYNILYRSHFRGRPTINASNQINKITFRWQYIALPLGFFLLSIILAAIFYAQLPAEVVYHFNGSTPDRTVVRGVFLAWMILPNIFFTIFAVFITRIVMFWAKYVPPGETPLDQLLPVMGNIMALPQIVMFVAILQLVLYNIYNTGIMPLWIFASVILAAGAVAMVIIFIRILRRYRKHNTNINQESK